MWRYICKWVEVESGFHQKLESIIIKGAGINRLFNFS
ncbi:MAG: hypothetical protein Hyperionvirus1_72 [Hyperionvirus sp.]|uniref:Uncharacterized protein n=1 Tax=Hyperionvirus sp. TaxID=2487770 RepID=A0A3G5A9I0_9VIRU|nr:MAG: hypothetical protein Hyperionvirus1_72 [Hyperionvirus sp.]